MRTFSNIGEKVGEVIPAFANLYTASTIVIKARLIRIIATLTHALPDAVERVILTTVTVPRRSRALTTST